MSQRPRKKRWSIVTSKLVNLTPQRRATGWNVVRSRPASNLIRLSRSVKER
jgi:hypothetical protein